MEVQQCTEQTVHVSIAGVHLIHDENLAAKTEEPHRLVPGGEHGEEGLIDRPHTDMG